MAQMCHLIALWELQECLVQHLSGVSVWLFCCRRGYPVIMFLLQYGCQHPAQDCTMSDWSFWSGCAKPCQPSVRVRVRHTERQPSNSGEPCPSLQERAGCMEYRDHHGGHCGQKSGIPINEYLQLHCFYLILYILHWFILFVTFGLGLHLNLPTKILNWFLLSGPAFITSMEFGKGRPKHDNYGNPLDPG